MKILILLLFISLIWMAYEVWKSPTMEETEDGGFITKIPTKKLSDLWRKQR